MADVSKDSIEVFDHATDEGKPAGTSMGDVDVAITGGHGGGDTGIINALYDYVIGEKTADEVSEIGISCKNHMMVFAAEQSRLEGKVIDLEEYMTAQINLSND